MPPPPLPPVKDEAELNNNVESKKEPVEVPSRPLANMLPSKYKDMDVTNLFPEFRHGQVSIKLFRVFVVSFVASQDCLLASQALNFFFSFYLLLTGGIILNPPTLSSQAYVQHQSFITQTTQVCICKVNFCSSVECIQ